LQLSLRAVILPASEELPSGTGYAYVTTKNKRTTPGKLEIKKFDPIARKHVVFVEKKISRG